MKEKVKIDCGCTAGWFAGAMMTGWKCKNCKYSSVSGSTMTPMYCDDCAKSKGVCKHCGKTFKT